MDLTKNQQTALALSLLPVFLLWQVNGIYLSALSRVSISLFWVTDFCQWVILPTALLLTLRRKTRICPEHYGLESLSSQWPRFMARTVLVFITSGLASYWVRARAWHLLGQPSSLFTYPAVYPDGTAGVFVWLYSAVTAGVVESIFFIGLPWLLFRNLLASPSRLFFTVIVSIVFATAHWEQGPHLVVAAFVFNAIACAWFFKLRSLWPVVGGHTLVDLVMLS